MAIDKTLLEPLTAGYKFYLDDLNNRKITGEYYDKIEKLYSHILELGENCSDILEFQGKMQQENIYTEINDAYMRAITEVENKKYMPQDGEIPEDTRLLRTNVDAMRNCIQNIRDKFDDLIKNATETQRMRMVVENNPEPFIKHIEDLIALSEEPGMTYPKFLRIQIERGLDKAAEGLMMRECLENNIECLEKGFMEPETEMNMHKEKLAEYDKAAEKSRFNIVDLHEWALISDRIKRKYKPEITRHKCIFEIFKQIIDDLNYWIESYCFSYALWEIEPWAPIAAVDLEKAVATMIRDEYIMPGIIYEREKQLFRYFGLRLKDIAKDEYFLNDIKSNRMDDSQENIEFLLLEVYPQCKPFNTPTQDLINKKTSLHKEKKEMNPDRKEGYLRLKRFCDSKYGEGWMDKYLKEQGFSENLDYLGNSKRWDIEEFVRNIDSKMVVHDLDEVFVENIVLRTAKEVISTLNLDGKGK
jgi:hypothetical protein